MNSENEIINKHFHVLEMFVKLYFIKYLDLSNVHFFLHENKGGKKTDILLLISK